MKRNSVKILILSLIFSTGLTFTACGEKQKEIQLTSDVKQELKDQEKNASKLVKVKELDFGDGKYFPISWKDDENIIATEGNKTKNDFIDMTTTHVDDINIYNINTKTSKISKINTITNAICGDVGEKDFRGKFLYTKDNKLSIYNGMDNTEKQIYDLSDIISEIKEYSKDDYMRNQQLFDKIHSGFVKGSDKYVFVVYSLYNQQNCKIKIINLQTGMVTSSPCFSGFFEGIDYPQCKFTLTYSKAKDLFYMSSFLSDALYEYKINATSTLKKIKTVEGQVFDITEDGKELYLSIFYKNKKISIVKYDIEKDRVTEILSDNKGTAKNQVSAYKGISLNYNKNIIAYSVENDIFDSSYKNISKSQDTSFIGNFDGNTIKNPKLLPVELMDNQNSCSNIIFNPKGNGFIYSVYYADLKDNKIKLNKVKSFIYEIKK